MPGADGKLYMGATGCDGHQVQPGQLVRGSLLLGLAAEHHAVMRLAVVGQSNRWHLEQNGNLQCVVIQRRHLPKLWASASASLSDSVLPCRNHGQLDANSRLDLGCRPNVLDGERMDASKRASGCMHTDVHVAVDI